MNNHNDIESRLREVKIRPLSERETDVMWQKIEKRMNMPHGFSAKTSAFFNTMKQNISSRVRSYKMRARLAGTLIGAIVFGTTGIAFAYADNSRPGDFLFPLGVAKEKIVILLTPTAAQNEVRLKYAEKRIEQGNSYLQALTATVHVATSTANTATSTVPVTVTATTSPVVIQDVVSRLSATIAYLMNVKADLSAHGNTEAANAIQNAIDKINAEVASASNQNAQVFAKVTERKNNFQISVNIASTTMKVAVANRNNGQQKIQITEKEIKGQATTSKQFFGGNNGKKPEPNKKDDDHGRDNDKKDDKKGWNDDNGKKNDNKDDKKRNDDDERNGGKFFPWNWFGGNSDKKTDICHKDGSSSRTISVSTNAVKAHLSHGDTVGKCATVTPPPSPTPTDTAAPVFSNIGATPGSVTSTAVWDTNENTTYSFWYGTTSPVINSANGFSASSGTLSTHHTASLSSLLPNTTYYYAIIAKDAAGNTATSSDHSFTTTGMADTTAPVISALSRSDDGTITWTTDEPATGKVKWGVAAPLPNILENTALSLNHSFMLTGLTASTTYKYVVYSSDAAGNTASTSEQSFTTN